MATIQELRTQLAPAQQALPPATIGLTDTNSFELSQRVAKVFASSDLVPQQYKGNMANCIIAINMAARLGADPLMVMQNLYIVHGRPGWSSQFLIATFNMCGRFTSMRFEFRGTAGKDDYGCRAFSTEKATGNTLTGSWIDMAMAKKEGWATKSGSKWQTMPEQMLMYRAASFFVRTHAPELSMGLHTAEEMRDSVFDMAGNENGVYEVKLADLAEVEKPVVEPITETEPVQKKESKAKKTKPVNPESPFVAFDRIQASDPEGATQALMDAGFTNEPTDTESMAKVVEAYEFGKGIMEA